MTPHSAVQRIFFFWLDRQSLAGLLQMLKIHDHFDLKVRAELAAEAPGHLERGVTDPPARGNFLLQHRVRGTALLE